MTIQISYYIVHHFVSDKYISNFWLYRYLTTLGIILFLISTFQTFDYTDVLLHCASLCFWELHFLSTLNYWLCADIHLHCALLWLCSSPFLECSSFCFWQVLLILYYIQTYICIVHHCIFMSSLLTLYMVYENKDDWLIDYSRTFFWSDQHLDS